MEPGALVTITQRGPLGTLRTPTSSLFVDDVVAHEGDQGRYWGRHPSHLDSEMSQWHLIELETAYGHRYCPLHEMAFAAVQ